MRLAVCTLLMFATALPAQDQPPAASKGEPEQPPPMQGSASGTKKDEPDPKAFRPSKPAPSNFPTQYLLYVAEAMKSFQARDFVGALSYADRADALLPPTVWTLNVRGAVAIERHDFALGEKYCNDALKMDPNFFPAKFNLCEIPFLQGKYPVARRGWQTLYERMAPDDPTVELLIYRIFLTYLLESDMTMAKEWLNKLPFPSQTPAYQYANAAWERQNGNLEKWQEWIESAEFIWPLSKRASFADVLLQLKWLKSDPFHSK